jgi:hypothetical protein
MSKQFITPSLDPARPAQFMVWSHGRWIGVAVVGMTIGNCQSIIETYSYQYWRIIDPATHDTLAQSEKQPE